MCNGTEGPKNPGHNAPGILRSQGRSISSHMRIAVSAIPTVFSGSFIQASDKSSGSVSPPCNSADYYCSQFRL